jgi:hypothetical protein
MLLILGMAGKVPLKGSFEKCQSRQRRNSKAARNLESKEAVKINALKHQMIG